MSPTPTNLKTQFLAALLQYWVLQCNLPGEYSAGITGLLGSVHLPLTPTIQMRHLELPAPGLRGGSPTPLHKLDIARWQSEDLRHDRSLPLHITRRGNISNVTLLSIPWHQYVGVERYSAEDHQALLPPVSAGTLLQVTFPARGRM